MRTPPTEHLYVEDELSDFLETTDGQQANDALLETLAEVEPRVPVPPGDPDKGVNPKDLVGVAKVPLSLVPPVAAAHCALGLLDGRHKYGLYNWRDYKVQAMIYLDAMKRHIDAYIDGEEYAPDSHVHHLGHVMACCAIILDADAQGCLLDDRPPPGRAAEMFERLQATVDFLNEKAAKRNA